MISRALWVIIISGICVCVQNKALRLRTMEHFVDAVQHLEDLNPTLTLLDSLSSLHKTIGQRDNITCGLIGLPENGTDLLHTPKSKEKLNLCRFLHQSIDHFITDDGEERGVVLTPDGTTVALSPLLLGIEMGLQASVDVTRHRNLYLLPLAKTLGLSFLQFQNSTPSAWLGPDGCWDNVSTPTAFTLSGEASLATDAVVHGGMDGAIIGRQFSLVNASEVKLSELLRSYYSNGMSEGHLRGSFRRLNFQNVTNPTRLQEMVADELRTHGRRKSAAVMGLIEEGMREFVSRYMDCPAIIPRCVWGAAPPRVPHHSLSPPLQFLFIHHTFNPSKPCVNLQMCSQNMRSMQRFHQIDRGWNDIGYSFVVGSDGFIYEGRGWMSQGAHTRGHNHVGYGVAFIGDYTSRLPSRYTLELVRHHLVRCGVSNGFLQENFTMLGHRQAVNTSCPGDSLYSEIKTWEHHQDTDPLKNK